MAAFATLGGVRITAGRVSIPWYGTWTADVNLSLTTTLPKTNALVVGDLQLQGTSERDVTFAGLRSVRLVGGAGGWQKQVIAKAYNFASGVPLSFPLKDAAADCGEVWGSGLLVGSSSVLVGVKGQNDLQAYAANTIGTAYVREAGPASRVLRQLTGLATSNGGGWWMDGTGATRLAARPTTAIASRFEVISWGGGRGLFGVATENISDWMPGRTFTNPILGTTYQVGYTLVEMTNDGALRVTVLVTP